LSKIAVHDEFYNDPAGTKLTTNTDWVLSQATRRYFAVLDYAGSAGEAKIIYNDNVTSGTAQYAVQTAQDTSSLPYAGNGAQFNPPVPPTYQGIDNFWVNPEWKKKPGALILTKLVRPGGPQACLNGKNTNFWSSEEVTASAFASFSPGYSTPTFCGEVATMTWGNGADIDSAVAGDSPLKASLTNSQVAVSYPVGWAWFQFNTSGGTQPYNQGPNYGLPVTGFAAIAFKGNNQNFGASWPLRWGNSDHNRQ